MAGGGGAIFWGMKLFSDLQVVHDSFFDRHKLVQEFYQHQGLAGRDHLLYFFFPTMNPLEPFFSAVFLL